MKLFELLCCLVVLAGCVDNPVDPTDRYQGPVEPCEVATDGSHEPWEEPGFDPDREDPLDSSPPRFWLPGPFGTWNTSPAPECQNDPRIPYVATEIIRKRDGTTEEFEHRHVKMYITYPTSSVPTVTGDGSVANGEFPVIIFAHANHDRRCNIYRGYYELHDHWASWGFVVVSLDQTKLNCKDGSKQNLQLRADGQVAAIDTLRALNEDEASRFFGKLDMSKIIFSGHSRGGGASFVAQKAYPAGIGIIDLQGVDVTGSGFGDATLPAVPVLGFTAGEDVDLNYPHCEPTEDQLGGEYTWVNINGGIHAYTADTSPIEYDDDPLISREQQHDLTHFYSTAFLVRLVGVPVGLDGEFAKLESAKEVLFSHTGAQIALQKLSPLGVFTRWRHDAPMLWVDDFDDEEDATNLLGGANVSDGFERSEDLSTYKPAEDPLSGPYGKARSRMLVGNGTLTLNLGEAGEVVDVSGHGTLQFRAKGPDQGATANLTVSLGENDVPIGDYRGPIELGNRMTQVVIPLEAFGVDSSSVDAITFESSAGSIFIDDVRFVTP